MLKWKIQGYMRLLSWFPPLSVVFFSCTLLYTGKELMTIHRIPNLSPLSTPFPIQDTQNNLGYLKYF